MKYTSNFLTQFHWNSEITNREAKEKVAGRLAAQVKGGETIGFGSGSTSFLAIQAIGKVLKEKNLQCRAIPTSHEVALACAALDIPTTTILNAKPDWAFDGADEVDPTNNLIKGRGGAMFREKLIMSSATKIYILIDPSKRVNHLGEKFPVPVEIHPMSIYYVYDQIERLGAHKIELRLAKKKDGPVITENGSFILDSWFSKIEKDLEDRIKAITGVIESGLFIGYPVEILCS